MLPIICFHLLLLVAGALAKNNFPSASVYSNPVLPGWHSDPSCVFVAEADNTLFCTTSTFLVFPGLPVYASQDFVNWKLVSNVFNRPNQIPELANRTAQQDGIYAATIRYRNGVFYVITDFIDSITYEIHGFIFTTSNPYDDSAWSEPLRFEIGIGYDPDIFWDDDGQVYITLASYSSPGIAQYPIDLETGSVGTQYSVWNGTGGSSPEGPHVYKKDGYYYLMIAEGGTALGHMETIARSRNIKGPYESYANNPILTNRNTTEYFQTVGHADLFQDASKNWWGVALSTRSGPAYQNYPMGRETSLFPVTWEEKQWPILHPVRGIMNGWELPRPSRSMPGSGNFVGVADEYVFEPGSSIPAHFVYWRFPDPQSFTISPPGHPNTLRLLPSEANLTAFASFNPEDGLTMVARRQTDTLFTFSVDVSLDAVKEEQEVGVTVFLTQYQHFDLGLLLLENDKNPSQPSLQVRYRTTYLGQNITVPATQISPLPQNWLGQQIRLQIQAINETHYSFSVGLTSNPSHLEIIGYGPTTVVSGGTGLFTGSLLGVYATSNGGSGTFESYIHKWTYTPQGQEIDFGVIIPFL